MSPLSWAVILLLIGFALGIGEVFIPSGGIIGFLSALAVITAIVMAFMQGGPGYGLSFVAVTVVVLPIGLAIALHYWPNTPMGRRIMLHVPQGDEVLPDMQERRELKSLVGQIGQAKSLMLPGGVVVVQGRNLDAVSEGMAIEAGQHVRVIEVRGTRLVVRPTDVQLSDRFATDGEPDNKTPSDPPLESLDLDSFENPFS